MSKAVQFLGWSAMVASFGIAVMIAWFMHTRYISAIQASGRAAIYTYIGVLVLLAAASLVAAARREKEVAARGFKWVMWAQVSFLAQAVAGFVLIQQFVIR